MLKTLVQNMVNIRIDYYYGSNLCRGPRFGVIVNNYTWK